MDRFEVYKTARRNDEPVGREPAGVTASVARGFVARLSRIVAGGLVVVVTAALGLIAGQTDGLLGGGVARWSYDLLHSIVGTGREAAADSPVAIVYLDLASFAHERQDPILPWPRALHAKLVERLTSAGARAIVFDVIFGASGPAPGADLALAEALRESRRTVLAAEYNNKVRHDTAPDQPSTRAGKLVPPFEPFAEAAAAWGVASLWIDDDLVVRRHFPALGPDRPASLAWAAADWLQLPVAQVPAPWRETRWMRYYGPPLTIPYVSYSEALDPAGVPADFFRDRIVFVGSRPMEGLFNERRDEFRSPFHSWSNKEYFTPGVEVHATQMLNLVRGDWLRRLPSSVEIWCLLGMAVLLGAGLIQLRPVPATLAALASGGVTLAMAVAAFHRNVWFPWLAVAVVQIPAALFGSWLYQFQEWFFTRRHLEAARREAENKIREQAALIDKAHDAILVQDLDGRILYANPSAERLYGWTSRQLQRDGIDDELAAPDADTARTARTTALNTGEWIGELRQQTRTGQTVIVASRWTLLRDDAGRPKAILLINTDVTAQKQLEVQFLRTQRLNTIGTLAGGMAHDLNNALAPILMGLQLLRRKGGDEESKRLLGLMETSTHRGADLVRQVLLFARGRDGELERLELGPLVKELEKMVRETFPKSIVVERFVPADLWCVRGNPTQLHQVLLNLCVNARDAMPAGGRLTFAADNVELNANDAAAIPEAVPGPYVSLLVADTGVGIPPEVRERIFEPFFTTKGEGRGTGIGLSTVLRIVKAHGGVIRVESEPGQGTTFEVLLPRAESAAPPVSAPGAAAVMARGNGELIIVADDEAAVRELVAEGLGAAGYRVLTAADGAEAVRLFKQHIRDVRVLVTDNAMPVADGPQVIHSVRRLRAVLPVILASGESGPEGAPVAAVPEDVVLLRKPFALEELLGAVTRCLAASSSGEEKHPNRPAEGAPA